eukprot:TRINITY_DN3198_c0_g2_i1.p1 TRINITY_DN3198_c0_g2~~TRINITY_DN3198_c0_g2_i1.p1  ORF type:complete len:324 (-),score=86.39 TRINITY_DN3198_c0_g2_i1:432-1403(-)
MGLTSPIPGDEHLLLLTAIITIGMQLAFFSVAATFKFDTVTDFAGGTNFVVLAIVTFILGGTFSARQILVLIFVALWGLRLSLFLLARILKTGTDARFDDKRDDFLKFLGFWIFQMFWVWTVSLPVTFLETTEADPSFGSAADIAGVIMYVVGLAIETASDQQKFNFKNDDANRGKWCDVGLWKYSRHPNYFGEILLWWGLFTISSSVFDAAGDNGEGKWGYATILGPLFVTGILLFVSGIPLLEEKADKKNGARQDYREYKIRTSVLIPVPPGIYGKLPVMVKQVLFFEWPLYDSTGSTSSGSSASGEAALLTTKSSPPQQA